MVTTVLAILVAVLLAVVAIMAVALLRRPPSDVKRVATRRDRQEETKAARDGDGDGNREKDASTRGEAGAARPKPEPKPEPEPPSTSGDKRPVSTSAKLASLVEDPDGVDLDITKLAAKGEVPNLAGEETDDEAAAETIPSLRFEGGDASDDDMPTGPIETIAVATAGVSDLGLARRRNEDSFVIDAKLGVYIVADGMGGYAGGDVASRLACTEIVNGLRVGDLPGGTPQLPRRARNLVGAITRANTAVFDKAKAPGYEGMGTTVVAGYLSLRRQRMYVGHVGDSRCYRLRAGILRQLTTDHTLAARGITGAFASHLRRAVGVATTVAVDLTIDTPLPGDVYLLCSDGLTKMVSDEEIQRIVTERILSVEHEDLRRASDALLVAANGAGGYDNVTVLLIGISDANA